MNNTTQECFHDYNQELHMTLSFWVSGVATVVTSCFGIIGNLLSLVVLSRKIMFSMFNKLLMCVCLADLSFLVFNLAVCPNILMEEEVYPTALYYLLECIIHFCLSVSIFIIVSCTIERHQAVCYPHTYKMRLIKMGENSLVSYYTLPTVFLSILLNVPRFISYTPFGLILQSHPIYLRFLLTFQCFHPIATTGILPFLILSILNFKIHRRVCSYGFSVVHKKEVHLTRILISIVISFLVLNLPRLILGLYEISRYEVIRACHEEVGNYMPPEWQVTSDIFCRYLMIISSSINIVIYCWGGKQFKTVLMSIICGREIPIQKSCTNTNSDIPKILDEKIKNEKNGNGTIKMNSQSISYTRTNETHV